MSTPTAEARFWWEEASGTPLPLAFVVLARVEGPEPAADESTLRRWVRVAEGVAAIARASGAAPRRRANDGATLLFYADDAQAPAPVQAFHAAREIWERMRFDLGVSVRLAVHMADVAWEPDGPSANDPAVELGRRLANAAADDTLVLTEEVFLSLDKAQRHNVALAGVSADGVPAYVFPAAAAGLRPDSFVADPDGATWEAFRRYANSDEIRQVRYVGLRLTKRPPPRLDLLDVFVAPEVLVRQPAALPVGEAGATGPDAVAADALSFVPWARVAFATAGPAEPFVQVFSRQRALVVLGDPGAGKTTLLRWLAVVASGGRPAMRRELGVSERLLPLPVSVGRLSELLDVSADGEPVVDALARYFGERGVGSAAELRSFLEARLAAGDALVLLDGLDETASDARAPIASRLQEFVARYPRNRFVVSSRVVGYVGWQLSEAGEVELSAFNDAQVERYVRAFVPAYRRWEGATSAEEAQRAGSELLTALAPHERLRALARNPFLLSALALIHRAEGQLPRHRVHVYEIVARALCETWGEARRLVTGSTEAALRYEEQAVPVLGHLALRLHERHPTGVAPESVVVDVLAEALRGQESLADDVARRAANDFLRQAGESVQLLVERGAGEWGFLHLMFQEFFVAAGLLAAERFEDVTLAHLFDPRWREVLRLGVGYMALVQKRPAAAAAFVRRVLEHREPGESAWLTEVLHKEIPLAVRLAAEAGDALPASLRTEISQQLQAWFAAESSGGMIFVGRSAGDVPDGIEALSGQQRMTRSEVSAALDDMTELFRQYYPFTVTDLLRTIDRGPHLQVAARRVLWLLSEGLLPLPPKQRRRPRRATPPRAGRPPGAPSRRRTPPRRGSA